MENTELQTLDAIAMALEIDPSDVHISVGEMAEIGGTGSIQVSEHGGDAPRAKDRIISKRTSAPYSVMLAGMLLTGCGEKKKDIPRYEDVHEVGGDPELFYGAYGVAEQPTPIPGEERKPETFDGLLTPPHAPSGYGMHQWQGHSEYNPVAVAWLAMKNTGSEPCTVEVTRLELSYITPSGDVVMGSSSINGVQVLADGTEGRPWGQFKRGLSSGSTFTISPDTPDYVHPFGPLVEIPSDATQVTVTFSAEITDVCIVGGGMDTYAEYGQPRVGDGYTQDGSDTDFIKEAIKTPWVENTIPPEHPQSFAIIHKRIDQDE